MRPPIPLLSQSVFTRKEVNPYAYFLSLSISLFLLLFPLAFAGCGTEKAAGEEKEIVLAAGRDLSPGEKDPYYSTVILKTWESLVGISDDGKVMPMLAESWESNAEKTEWIFI